MVHEEEYWLENIILFQNETDKTGMNNKKSKKSTEKAAINGSRTGLSYTAELDAKQKRKHWEMVEEEEEKLENCLGKITEICPGKKEEEGFEEKSNDVLVMDSMRAEAKIQCLAAGMIKLVPDIFFMVIIRTCNLSHRCIFLYFLEFYPAHEQPYQGK